MKIRPFRPEDLGQLVELWRALAVEGSPEGLVLYPPTDDNTARWRSWVADAVERGEITVLVAEADGLILGYVLFGERKSPLKSPYRRGVIHDLYVRPGWRRKGLGKRLLEEALDEMRAKGLDIATVSVAITNRAALSLYRKLGFEDFMLTLAMRLR